MLVLVWCGDVYLRFGGQCGSLTGNCVVCEGRLLVTEHCVGRFPTLQAQRWRGHAGRWEMLWISSTNFQGGHKGGSMLGTD